MRYTEHTSSCQVLFQAQGLDSDPHTKATDGHRALLLLFCARREAHEIVNFIVSALVIRKWGGQQTILLGHETPMFEFQLPAHGGLDRHCWAAEKRLDRGDT